MSVYKVLFKINQKSKTDECLCSLQPLVTCLSNYMIKKIANSGLAYSHLKLAFDRGGAEGLEGVNRMVMQESQIIKLYYRPPEGGRLYDMKQRFFSLYNWYR